MPEPQRRFRILLVDDHALFRESVARFLDEEPGLQVVGSCASVDEAKEFLQKKSADVVLLDFDLGQRDGLDFMRVAENLHFPGKILLVTADVDESNAASLIRHGIAGIFLKYHSPVLLVEAIRTVLSGNVWFEQGYLQRVLGQESKSSEDQQTHARRLTEREREVLSFVLEGLANKEIADRLSVSESSVKATMQQLFQKTGVRTRSQLVRIALEQYKDQL